MLRNLCYMTSDELAIAMSIHMVNIACPTAVNFPHMALTALELPCLQNISKQFKVWTYR